MISVQSPGAQPPAHPSVLDDVLTYDAACQRRALRGIGCATWMHLDVALVQLQQEHPGQHFGTYGETYTSQVVMRAMDLAYPMRDVTFCKLVLTATGAPCPERGRAPRRDQPCSKFLRYPYSGLAPIALASVHCNVQVRNMP